MNTAASDHYSDLNISVDWWLNSLGLPLLNSPDSVASMNRATIVSSQKTVNRFSASSALKLFTTFAVVLYTVVPLTHAASNPAPAELRGNVVRLAPASASFNLPARWIERSAKGEKNLHISREQLAEVEKGEGEWDTEYGEVVNSVLEFDRCTLHAGDEGWGAESGSFGDLQMRAYVGEWPQNLLLHLIRERGMDAAHGFSKEASVEERSYKSWQISSIRYSLRYFDYGGTATIEFYSRVCSSKTVVLVFMYCAGSHSEKDINEILASFGCQEDVLPLSETSPKREPTKKAN